MKHLNFFSMLLCAAGVGTQIAAHNYKLAIFNVFGVLFFQHFYESYKKKEQK